LSELFNPRLVTGGAAVIGKSMIIKGSIHSKQDIFLDGELEGDLDVENYRVTIGPHGKAVANTRAREVDIHGAVVGNIESNRISIRTSGRLEGDIRTAGIVIENGAFFKGRVDIIDSRGPVVVPNAAPAPVVPGAAPNVVPINGQVANGK
jgi:cytoskeletal protein CcmA (bactofilin family)